MKRGRFKRSIILVIWFAFFTVLRTDLETVQINEI